VHDVRVGDDVALSIDDETGANSVLDPMDDAEWIDRYRIDLHDRRGDFAKDIRKSLAALFIRNGRHDQDKPEDNAGPNS
jgi:hypothetical protein